jgi:amino acid permease
MATAHPSQSASTEASSLLNAFSLPSSSSTKTTVRIYNSSFPNENDDTKTSAESDAATYFGTVLNIMKTCMGTGCLALAYACQQGGIILYIFGLLCIAIWNLLVMCQLIHCLTYLPKCQQQRQLGDRNQHEVEIVHLEDFERIITLSQSKKYECTAGSASLTTDIGCKPPPGTSTMGIVAWYAFGKIGLQTLDCVVVLLFLGIITAYVAAVISFVNDTPFSINRWVNAILTGCVMGAIAIVPHIGYLSSASALGLLVLFSAFVVIAGYGIVGTVIAPTMEDIDPTAPEKYTLALWPTSLGSISHWYGIAVFGYGVVPLTYNFQESMKEPHRMIPATATALACVAISYVILGVGLYAIFPRLTSDVLHELPSAGFLPIMTRWAMVGTIVFTAPLLIVPCAEIIEGRLNGSPTTNTNTTESTTDNKIVPLLLLRAVVRFSVVTVCVMVAVVLPNFVEVLALVGCFCVALVSFCVPPALHLRLIYLAHLAAAPTSPGDTSLHNSTLGINDVIGDVLLLCGGIVTTIVSTICTLRN